MLRSFLCLVIGLIVTFLVSRLDANANPDHNLTDGRHMLLWAIIAFVVFVVSLLISCMIVPRTEDDENEDDDDDYCPNTDHCFGCPASGYVFDENERCSDNNIHCSLCPESNK